MSQEDLRVIKTRRIIREALIGLLAEKEISHITITELSQRAMINRKTFYRHYDSVAEVVSELENEILSEFSETLKSSNTSCLDVAGVISDISALIQRRRDYFSKMMKLNPDIFSAGRIKAMLRRAVAVSLKNTGGIEDPAAADIMSQFVVSGLLSLYAEWFDNGCTGSLDSITQTAKQLITGGLGSFVPADRMNI